MFTGIIEKKGRIRSLEKSDKNARLWIESGYTDLVEGESLAVNGVCLTVTEFTPQGDCLLFVSSETLAKTQLGSLRPADAVNLERAMQASSRFGGHIVQGHVDGVGTLKRVERLEDAHAITVSVPLMFAPYLIDKGSITLSGVSLTVNRFEATSDEILVSIMIIPHTWSNTTLGEMKPGDLFNIEADVLAKYMERLWTLKHAAQ